MDMKHFANTIICLFATAFVVHGQSLTDVAMDSIVREALTSETAAAGGKVAGGSVVVLENKTGNVRTYVEMKNVDGSWRIHADGSQAYYPNGCLRAIMYLTLLESGVSPDAMYYSSRIYQDAESGGICLTDRQLSEPSRLPLKVAMQSSDIALLSALEQRFGYSPGEYAFYLNASGAWLRDTETDMTLNDFIREYTEPINFVEVFNHANAMTGLQMAIWMQSVANNGMMLAPRFQETDESHTIPALNVKSKNLEALKTALRDAVVSGQAQNANSRLAIVSGVTNVASKTSADGLFFCSFCGFSASHTVIVNLESADMEHHFTAASIARRIFDWIAQNRKDL